MNLLTVKEMCQLLFQVTSKVTIKEMALTVQSVFMILMSESDTDNIIRKILRNVCNHLPIVLS